MIYISNTFYAISFNFCKESVKLSCILSNIVSDFCTSVLPKAARIMAAHEGCAPPGWRASGTEQEHLLSKAKVKHGWVTIKLWMGDHYMLGFVPALSFLWSQILCRRYKRLLDETMN